MARTGVVSPRRRRVWLAGYAAALFLAFPHPVAGHVLDGGLVAGWVAAACLWRGLAGLAPRRAAGAAFLAAWAAHAAIFHWIYVVTVTYGHAPGWAGVVAPIGLALYPAVFVAALGAAAAAWRPGGWAAPFVAAALWAVSDHLRTFALSGFPWAVAGYTQHANPALLGLAAWTGVHGLGFAVALGGAAIAAWLGGARGPAAAALAGVVLLHGLGLVAAPDPIPAQARGVRIAAVQGNVDQGVKWSAAWSERTLARYERYTRQAAEEGAQLVLWPETAVPGAVDASPELAARLAALARETGAALVVGGVGLEPAGERWRYYDSAFVFAPDGALVARYDKSHLVPFGEYLPLRWLLGGLLGAVATGIAPEDVSPGGGPRVVDVPVPGGSVGAGIPICYELLFPDLVRRFVRGGAGVLLGITNDAWYGRTGAPYQFLAITAMRSAETGVWTARAANSGVSAFIDERGRVRARTPIFEEALLVEDVPVRDGAWRGTFYDRHGNVFVGACWLVAASAALAARRRRPEIRA